MSVRKQRIVTFARFLLCRLWWYETVARPAEIDIILFILVLVGK